MCLSKFCSRDITCVFLLYKKNTSNMTAERSITFLQVFLTNVRVESHGSVPRSAAVETNGAGNSPQRVKVSSSGKVNYPIETQEKLLK